MPIKAIEHVSRLRGGSQAQVMLADDGNRYVAKFQGNPQHNRVLANEYLACSLARLIGFNVPEPVIIDVDEQTIREQQITFTLAGRTGAPHPGPQFGSRLVTAELIFDLLPHTMLGQIRNVAEFAGILAFDKWTSNADGRQVVFHKNTRQRKYTATWIDFGYCFNAGEWSFPTSLCGALMRATKSMSTSRRGMTSLPGSKESRRSRPRNYRRWRRRSPLSGMVSVRSWNAFRSACWSVAALFVS